MAASGEAHYNWKGNTVGYRQAHAWVRREMMKTLPLVCSDCGSTKRVEVANITGIYNRDISNYKFLCKKCHNDLDGQINNLKQGVDAILQSPRRNPHLTEKKCTKCGIIKPLVDFYTDKDSFRSECKECTKMAHKAAWVPLKLRNGK